MALSEQPQSYASTTNQAFIFIKPHAAVESCAKNVQKLVEEQLTKAGIKFTPALPISSKEIDEKKLIDTHYYAIASKATLKKPHELNVPADRFEEKFGLPWQTALDKGLCFNAVDGAAKLGGLDATQMEKRWRETKKTGNIIKFGGGFYCAKLDDYYMFNGFFMSMREKYVAEGQQIISFSVTWDEKDLAWEDFRGKVLGPTDPSTAPEDSIRGMIYRDWEKLGLAKQPDTGDNGVHASASPFEGLAEHMNWLKKDISQCAFGQQMLKCGISEDTIKAWSVDPQVTLNAAGEKGSCFDALEDMNAIACIGRSVQLNLLNC